MHHMDATKTHKEKARWEPYKDVHKTNKTNPQSSIPQSNSCSVSYLQREKLSK